MERYHFFVFQQGKTLILHNFAYDLQSFSVKTFSDDVRRKMSVGRTSSSPGSTHCPPIMAVIFRDSQQVGVTSILSCTLLSCIDIDAVNTHCVAGDFLQALEASKVINNLLSHKKVVHK